MSFQTSIIKRIAKGTLGVSIYTGFYQLMLLLISIISARLLNVTDFGKVSILQSTVSLFVMFATMGLGSVAIKLIAEHKGRFLYSIFLINFSLCLSATLAIYFCSDFIASSIYQDNSLTSLIKGLSLFVLLSGLTQIQSSVLAGCEDYKNIGKINFFIGLLSIFIIYFMVSYYGVMGWLVGVILLEFIKCVLLFIIIYLRFKQERISVTYTDIVEVTHLTIPIALSSFLIMPVNWYLTRELLITDGYQDVALLNISNQWVAVLTFLPIAIGNAMLPIMSKMIKSDERKSISHLALKLNFAVSFSFAFVAFLLAEFILSFYGEIYIEGKSVFIYILLLAVVLSLTNQLNNKVIADGKPVLMMNSNLIWFFISLPFGWYLISVGMGVSGLLLGRFIGYVGKFLYLYKQVK